MAAASTSAITTLTKSAIAKIALQSLDRMKKARKTMGSNKNAKLRWALAKIVVMVNDYRKYLEVDRAYSIGVLDDIGEVAKAALRKPSITM